MADRNLITMQPARHGWWIAFAAVMAWLMIQNSILLLWFTNERLGPVFTVARALVNLGIHLMAELWMLPLAVLLGVALALTGGDPPATRATSREVSRV